MRHAYREAENKPNLAVLLYGLILFVVILAPAAFIKYSKRRKPV